MYDNRGKRDILIFPKFNNIDKIQEIRNKYDKLATLIPPHITLVFPFNSEMTNEELIDNLSTLLKDFSPFNVTFKGISLSNDNYIFLNCIKGSNEIIKLHDKLYEKILPTYFNKTINYIPHITLGQTNNLNRIQNFNYEFNAIINEITIELIGENEESIIIKNIKL